MDGSPPASTVPGVLQVQKHGGGIATTSEGWNNGQPLVSEEEYGNSQWKILRGCRGVGDLDSGGFTEPVVGESLVMNNPLAVLDLLWWWLCVKDKNLIWGHVVKQVTTLRLEWPASRVYLLKFIPGTLIQLQCIYRNGEDRQWEPAGQVCQHFCLVKPCSSHPFTIHYAPGMRDVMEDAERQLGNC